ncbi:MAG: BamA/TamA family outer membrane protein [Blastocatellia bacterium]
MIRLALKTATILTASLALISSLAMASPCQAQTTSNEAAEATEPTVAETNAAAFYSNWSRALKDYALFPPAPQITGPAGPTPTARPTDRIKVREYLAPIREVYAAIRLGPKYANALVGGFEQGSGIGFGGELTTADRFSRVEFRASAFISTLLYSRARLDAYFPKIGDERTHANVWFNYFLVRGWNFYGIGPNTPQATRTSFRLEERSLNGLFQRDFTYRFKAGVYAGLANAGASNGNKDLPPINLFFSGDPSVTPITRWAPGLDMNAEIFYYGLYGEYDGRDNTRGLTKGFYLYGLFGSYDGIDNGALFTDYGWLGLVLDGKVFIPLGSDSTSFAARVFTSLQNPKGGSQIPFYYQSFLGGRLFVRGFRDFRFRGNNSLVLSAELRQIVWVQKDDRGLDIHGFGDAGQVWGDNRSSTNPVVLANNQFSSSNWRFGAGGGITYRYNKQLAFRVEIGHSHEGNQVYFSLTRGF